MTVEPPPPADDDASIPDEVWEQFLDDSEGKIRASAPKEPSARARMVTGRLRSRDADAAAAKPGRAGRFKRKGKNPAEPAGWRTGPAWEEMRRGERGPWRNRLRTAFIVLIAVLVAVIAMNPSAALSWMRGGSSSFPTTPATGPSGSAGAATTGAAPSDLQAYLRPFEGSPAAQWPDGADGIALPAAHPVGTWSADQVSAALKTTKNYLVATNLDPGALRGGRPSAAIALIDPQEHAQLDPMQQALKAPSEQHDPLSFLTRYNPAQFTLAGKVIKVRGSMTFKAGPHGSVQVDSDYTFVYPFTKADGSTEYVARAIVRRTLSAEFDDPSAGTLWVINSNADIGDDLCGVHDGYLHPSFPMDAPSDAPATGPAIDPYDGSKPLTAQHTCGTVTRS